MAYNSNGGTGNGFYTCDDCGTNLGKLSPSITISTGVFGKIYQFCSEGHKLKFQKENLQGEQKKDPK